MSIDDSKSVEFSLPLVIKNYIYDLHQSSRKALRADEVQRLYEIEFKEITDKYFSSSPWPDVKSIAVECDNDEFFLYFYREMALRHLFLRLKPQLKDYFEAWNNYIKIFEFLLATPNPEIALNTQWIYDLMVEFVYEFQGFCQYRSQLHQRTPDDIRLLSANVDAWTYPAVSKILNGLIKDSGNNTKKFTNITSNSTVKQQFGYLAAIELARLECLSGDHVAALQASSLIDINERCELFELIPTCYVNLLYHIAVSQLHLRQFTNAIDTLNNVILYISRLLKPGVSNLRNNAVITLNRMLDRVLALAAIVISISPSQAIDEQVKDIIVSKLKDKYYNLLIDNNIKLYQELYENACPKFISIGIPDYSTVSPTNIYIELFNRQVSLLMNEILQYCSILKLRSYLRLYSSIELSKLARYNNIYENQLLSKLISYKYKSTQIDNKSHKSDINYIIIDDHVQVLNFQGLKLDKEKKIEKYFIAGIRKHADILSDIQRVAKLNNI